MKKAEPPKKVRKITAVDRGITETEFNFEPDTSEGQIDIDILLVKLEAVNLPKTGELEFVLKIIYKSFRKTVKSQRSKLQVDQA